MVFVFEYLRNINHLRRELESRDRAYYRARKYLLNRFGFDVDDCLPELSGVGFWRQFLTPNFENLVGEILARLYGMERFDLTYLKDGFTTRNPFKYSLVRPKFVINDGRRWILRKYFLADRFLNHQVIEDIGSLDNLKKAYRVHIDFVENLGYSSDSWDISAFFSTFVKCSLETLERKDAGRVFRTVFVLTSRNDVLVRKKFEFNGEMYRSENETLKFGDLIELAAEGLVMPATSTYYSELFYLLPGILLPKFVQIEAVFETADECIQTPALQGFRKCKEITGVYPLVIPIPDFNVEDGFRFTKNPACTTVCLPVEEAFEAVNPESSISFYRTAYMIGKRLVQTFKS
ncbi:hypothetical protein [Geoglobus acetivorans]|uniref:Uncharacterized protein n=1 Tax=Geoglobus acetivorans TaxID=565033 RepID=A0A0A7GER0_GEOAI|nr:hypothetical protein GACE_0393 [Geoglobus acetivorans]